MSKVELAFLPGDYVVVSFLGLKYNGRVEKSMVCMGYINYNVNYANDRGEIQNNNFREDELEIKL